MATSDLAYTGASQTEPADAGIWEYSSSKQMWTDMTAPDSALISKTTPDAGSYVIASASETNAIVTIDTLGPQIFQVGEQVTISGMSVASYDGTYAIASIGSSTSFSFVSGTTGLAGATGGTFTDNNVTLTASTIPGLTVGQSFTLAGESQAGYNGTFTVASIGVDKNASPYVTYSDDFDIASAKESGTTVTITTSTVQNFQVGEQVNIEVYPSPLLSLLA